MNILGFDTVSDDVIYVMMEMRQDYVNHHIQKIVAFFAAMVGHEEKESQWTQIYLLTLGDKRNNAVFDCRII
jgi:deoxyribodipyrimidine photolyase-related protein